MNGSKFLNQDDWTLFAGGITVDGGFFGRHGFESKGAIRLVGACLNGGIFLDHANLMATNFGALVADNMKVEGRMVCDGLVVEGAVRMPRCRINGQLSWDGSIIRASDSGLDCRRLVAEEFILTSAEPIDGSVDLGGTHVSVFCDDPKTWPTDLRLDGFVYGSLIARSRRSGPDRPPDRYLADSSNASAEILPARERLRWLRLTTTGYRPQPYEQLAQFYRSVGHDDEARKVLLAKQRNRRSTQTIAGRPWGYLLDWSVGYGYRPWLAALWLIALVTAGTIVFSLKPPPALDPRTAPEFDPFVYTINLLLPIGQFIQSNQSEPCRCRAMVCICACRRRMATSYRSDRRNHTCVEPIIVTTKGWVAAFPYISTMLAFAALRTKLLFSADEHAQTSVSEHGDRHSPRPAGALDGAEAVRGSLEVDAQPSAARIHPPEGAARKVSAPVRRAHIPDTSAASAPEPGTWKDPDPRRRSSRGSEGSE